MVNFHVCFFLSDLLYFIVNNMFRMSISLILSNNYFSLLWRKLADKVAAAGYYVVVPDLLEGDPFKPHDSLNDLPVWLKDHGPVVSSYYFENVLICWFSVSDCLMVTFSDTYLLCILINRRKVLKVQNP